MLREIIRHKVIFLGLVLMMSTPVAAVEQFDGESFLTACRSHAKKTDQSQAKNGADADICEAFVIGYLSAIQSFYLSSEEEKGYYERAVETRAKGLLHKDQRLKRKRYCIPEGESVKNIIARVNELKLNDGEVRSAENVVKAVLDQYYRCS